MELGSGYLIEERKRLIKISSENMDETEAMMQLTWEINILTTFMVGARIKDLYDFELKQSSEDGLRNPSGFADDLEFEEQEPFYPDMENFYKEFGKSLQH